MCPPYAKIDHIGPGPNGLRLKMYILQCVGGGSLCPALNRGARCFEWLQVTRGLDLLSSGTEGATGGRPFLPTPLQAEVPAEVVPLRFLRISDGGGSSLLKHSTIDEDVGAGTDAEGLSNIVVGDQHSDTFCLQ